MKEKTTKNKVEITTEIKKSLYRVKNISKGVYYLFNIFFYLYCLVGIFVIAMSVLALFSPETLQVNTSTGWEGVVGMLLLAIPIAVILKLLSLIFKDIANSETPFTMKQVKRLRLIALFTLIDVIINFIFSTGLLGITSNIVGTLGVVSSEYTNHATINLFEAFGALVVFCLSFAFEYGFLLQEDCNDTV